MKEGQSEEEVGYSIAGKPSEFILHLQPSIAEWKMKCQDFQLYSSLFMIMIRFKLVYSMLSRLCKKNGWLALKLYSHYIYIK